MVAGSGRVIHMPSGAQIKHGWAPVGHRPTVGLALGVVATSR